MTLRRPKGRFGTPTETSRTCERRGPRSSRDPGCPAPRGLASRATRRAVLPFGERPREGNLVSKETAARDGASNKTPVWYEPRSKQQTPTGGRLPCSLTARGATGMASPRSAAAVGADDDWAALCSLEAALEADLRVAETASAERSQSRGDAEGTSDGTSAVAALDARAATYWNAPRRRSENVAPSDLGDGRASEGTWAPADLGASSRRVVASSRGRPTYSPHHGAYGDYTNRLLHRPGREPLRARVGDSSVPSLNAPDAFELAVDDVVGAWILPKSSTDSTRRAGTTTTREAPSTTRKTLFATNHAVPSSAPRKLATEAEASPRTSDSERLTKLAEPRGRGSPPVASRRRASSSGGRPPFRAGGAPRWTPPTAFSPSSDAANSSVSPRKPRPDFSERRTSPGAPHASGDKPRDPSPIAGGESSPTREATTTPPFTGDARFIVDAVEARVEDKLRELESRLLASVTANRSPEDPPGDDADMPTSHGSQWWSDGDEERDAMRDDAPVNDAWSRLNGDFEAPASGGAEPVRDRPLRAVKRSVDAYLERRLKSAIARKSGGGDRSRGKAAARRDSAKKTLDEPVYSPARARSASKTSLRRRIRRAGRGDASPDGDDASSSSTSDRSNPSSGSSRRSPKDSSDDSSESTPTSVGGSRLDVAVAFHRARRLAAAMDEWWFLLRRSEDSADRHVRGRLLGIGFRAFVRAAAETDVHHEIVRRFARAKATRCVRRAIRAWRREAKRAAAFRDASALEGHARVLSGTGSSFGRGLHPTRRSASTMTTETGDDVGKEANEAPVVRVVVEVREIEDVVEDLVDALVDDVEREGRTNCGPLSSETPEAITVEDEEDEFFHDASPSHEGAEDDDGAQGHEEPVAAITVPLFESLPSRSPSGFSPEHAEKVAAATNDAAEAVSVAVRGLLGLWRLSTHDGNELGRDEDLTSVEDDDAAGDEDGEEARDRHPHRIIWDATRGEIMVFVGGDADEYVPVSEYVDFVESEVVL